MITSSKIDNIQRKIKLAIAQIEKDENVEITFGGSRYNSAYYSNKMTVKTLEKTVKVENVYESICKTLGFTQNVIGMTFVSDKGICTITEIKTRNRLYPVIANCSNGKSYKYSVAQIKSRIGGDKIINRNKNLDNLFK